MRPSLLHQPASLAYWDPANLLQITSDGDNDSVKINCVGRAKHDNRCRWDIAGPELSKIRPMLRAMSVVKPEAITEDTLRRLASLCLCSDWHSGQLHKTVTRWVGVVRNAARLNKNLIASVGSVSDDWEERLAKSEQMNMSLSAQVVSMTAQHQECQRANISNKTTIASLEEVRQAMDARFKEESTARSKAELRTLTLSTEIETAKEELNGCLKRRDQLEEENKILRDEVTRLSLAQDSLEACQAMNDQLKRNEEMRKTELNKLERARESLAAELEKMALESDAFKDCERQLAAELKQGRADLNRERGRNETLNGRIAGLKHSNTGLLESISACWSHRFWAWVSRQRASLKGSASEIVSEEMILQASKV